MQNSILDEWLRKDVVKQLRLKKVSSRDSNAILKETRNIVMSKNNIDTPDEHRALFKVPTKVKPVDKSRTLAAKDIQRKSVDSLAGATVNFAPVLGSTRFSIGGKPITTQSFRFDKQTVVGFIYYYKIYS